MSRVAKLVVQTDQKEPNIELLFQKEVVLNIDATLFYIKSGEQEIKNYVEKVSKRELDNHSAAIITDIDNHVETVNKPELQAVGNEQINNIASYVDEVSKAEIDAYVTAEVKPYSAAAISSAAASLSSEQAAKASELNCQEIEARIGKPLNIKGTVALAEDLPVSGNHEGDMYLVGTDEETNRAEYAWLDSHWEKIGTTAANLSASETYAGIAMLATAAEVADGTDDTKIVTPAKQ